jgi:hypothetical protein
VNRGANSVPIPTITTNVTPSTPDAESRREVARPENRRVPHPDRPANGAGLMMMPSFIA